ncbi:benzoate/H(+) symporter BenE family transporter [Mycobacterium leprae]|uniref:benzoate/H(+) symporter BenE family transporter n=1 Tax=Mycobacterium leprae TaxID=1769 RepID=UPI0022AA2502|nr:benzoate/H(+) symporter BenE family transporter [Mycobacterium leprae]
MTMADQNVPGVVLSCGCVAPAATRVPWREAMTVTGFGTLLFGGHAINLAAVSAAVPASHEVHRDPERR